MLHLRRYFVYACTLVFSGFTLFYLWWYSTGTHIKKSTWSCTGTGRNQICIFTNFCVDKSNGPFIISSSKPPKVNLINGNSNEDIWFEPKRVDHSVNAIHVNETVFVYGLYSPFHFSHYLYNGLLPLYSTMLENNAPLTSWTLRAATFWNKHTPIDLVLPSHNDIVLEEADLLTSRQVLPSYKPMCFANAVIPTQHYQSFKDYVFKQPEVPDNACAASRVVYKEKGQYRVGILNRKNSRHITNVPELISKLMALNKTNDGIDYSVVTIDFEKGCDIINTANSVKDLDILIAPFGNGLGAGLFMKDDSTLISISARYYSEDWFKYPMTAIGRRIFDFKCNSSICQQYDQDAAAALLKEYGVVLNATEMIKFVTDHYPKDVLLNHLPEEKVHSPILIYQKDVSRRIDVDSFLPYLKKIMDNKPTKGVPFPETCRKENICCDTDCSGPLQRNIFGTNNAWISATSSKL